PGSSCAGGRLPPPPRDWWQAGERMRASANRAGPHRSWRRLPAGDLDALAVLVAFPATEDDRLSARLQRLAKLVGRRSRERERLPRAACQQFSVWRERAAHLDGGAFDVVAGVDQLAAQLHVARRPIGPRHEDEVPRLDVGYPHVLLLGSERETAHGRRDVVHSKPAEVAVDVELDAADLGGERRGNSGEQRHSGETAKSTHVRHSSSFVAQILLCWRTRAGRVTALRPRLGRAHYARRPRGVLKA